MSNPQAEYNEDKAAEMQTLSTGSPDTKLATQAKPVCKLCEHWRGFPGSPAGSCRGNPPQVVSSSEYRWPVTAADESGCRLFALDAEKQAAYAGIVKSSAEDEARMRRVAQELLEKAESGELGAAVEELVPKVDAVGPAPFVNNPVAKALKPNVPQKHIPVLTVAQMRQFKGK